VNIKFIDIRSGLGLVAAFFCYMNREIILICYILGCVHVCENMGVSAPQVAYTNWTELKSQIGIFVRTGHV